MTTSVCASIACLHRAVAARPTVYTATLRMEPKPSHLLRPVKLFSSPNEGKASPQPDEEPVDIREMVAAFSEETVKMMDKVRPHESYQKDAADMREALTDLAQCARDRSKPFEELSGIATLLRHLRVTWTCYGDIFSIGQTAKPEEFVFTCVRAASARGRGDVNKLLDAFNLTEGQLPKDELRRGHVFAMLEVMKISRDTIEFYAQHDAIRQAHRGKGGPN